MQKTNPMSGCIRHACESSFSCAAHLGSPHFERFSECHFKREPQPQPHYRSILVALLHLRGYTLGLFLYVYSCGILAFGQIYTKSLFARENPRSAPTVHMSDELTRKQRMMWNSVPLSNVCIIKLVKSAIH